MTKLPCSAGVLFWWIKDKSSRLFISNDHVWYRVRVDGKGGGQEKAPPLPSTSFWPSVTPLGKIFFLSSAFRWRKIRDDSYNSADYDETTVTTDSEHFKIGS